MSCTRSVKKLFHLFSYSVDILTNKILLNLKQLCFEFEIFFKPDAY